MIGSAYAINGTGLVVGNADIISPPGSPVYHAVIFDTTKGTQTDLGVLASGNESTAYAINVASQVVGTSNVDVSNTVYHAFWYDGVMLDLNTLIDASDPLKSFVTLVSAVGINDNSLVVVNGVDSRDAMTHAYLMQLPTISITADLLSFPNQTVGSSSQPQTVTVTNVGTAAVAIGTPAASADFSQTNDCPVSLAAATACSIQVSFAPVAGGDLTGTVTFTANGTLQTLALAGTAPISATLSATPAVVTTNQSITIVWQSSAGATCVASGGAMGDGWNGTLAAISGTRAVTETKAAMYTYTMNCTAGSLTESASAQVTVNSPHSGGGSVDVTSLIALASLIGINRRRRGASMAF